MYIRKLYMQIWSSSVYKSESSSLHTTESLQSELTTCQEGGLLDPTSEHAAKPDLPLQHTYLLTSGPVQTCHEFKHYAGIYSKKQNAGTTGK